MCAQSLAHLFVPRKRYDKRSHARTHWHSSQDATARRLTHGRAAPSADRAANRIDADAELISSAAPRPDFHFAFIFHFNCIMRLVLAYFDCSEAGLEIMEPNALFLSPPASRVSPRSHGNQNRAELKTKRARQRRAGKPSSLLHNAASRNGQISAEQWQKQIEMRLRICLAKCANYELRIQLIMQSMSLRLLFFFPAPTAATMLGIENLRQPERPHEIINNPRNRGNDIRQTAFSCSFLHFPTV